MRVAFLAWGVWFLVGLWMIIHYVWKEIPAAQAQNRERAEQQKWLPKRKK
jgi:hypothetical protein